MKLLFHLISSLFKILKEVLCMILEYLQNTFEILPKNPDHHKNYIFNVHYF